MKLTVARHGQTEENLAGIVQGHLQGRLTKKGIGQAESLAVRLRDNHFDHIYSSDLDRCVDTAREVVKYHPSTKIELTKDLRETSFGDVEGISKFDVDWEGHQGSFLDKKPTNGESISDLRKRVIRFLDQLKKERSNQNILFITHAGPMRVIKSYLEDTSLEQLFSEDIDNCEVWTFEMD